MVPYVVDQRNVVAGGFDLTPLYRLLDPGGWVRKAGELPVGCECDKDVVGAETHRPPRAAALAAPLPRWPPGCRAGCDFTSNFSTRQHLCSQQKAALTGSAKGHLDTVIVARQLPRPRFQLSSPATPRPPRLPELQPKLSEKRADAVRAYLLAKVEG